MWKGYLQLTHSMTKSGIGPLIIRLMVGFIFFYHGTQKLFGWFGGPGIEGAEAFFTSVDIPLPAISVWVAAIVESLGGILLAFGFLTRPASFFLAIVMITASYVVHAPNGFYISNNGYEYPSLLAIISIGFIFAGPGILSIDRLFCLCCQHSGKDMNCPIAKCEKKTEEPNES